MRETYQAARSAFIQPAPLDKLIPVLCCRTNGGAAALSLPGLAHGIFHERPTADLSLPWASGTIRKRIPTLTSSKGAVLGWVNGRIFASEPFSASDDETTA